MPRGRLPGLLDRGALGRRTGMRALQQHAGLAGARRLPVRMRRLRPSDQPDVGHAAGKDRKPFKVWFRAVFEISARRNGISAMELQRIMGFGSYKTAWTWLHKLRAALVLPGRELLSQAVQIDEAFVGGTRGGKEMVLVATETTDGRVRLAHAANNDEATSSISPTGVLPAMPPSPPTGWPATMPAASANGRTKPRCRPTPSDA